MKKLCIAISLILLVCAVVPGVALAASDVAHNDTYVPSHKGYNLKSIFENGVIVGVRFSGYYFGSSGITVVAEIYSSTSFALDFYIGDNDYVDEGRKQGVAYLTQEQTERKHKVIEIFEQIHSYVNWVDKCANTQYNGDGLISDIYRYNATKQGDRLEIDEATFEMLKIAKEMYSDTDGAFNPAVYRLVDLWGFSSRIYSNGAFDLQKYPYDRPVTAQEFFSQGYPLPDEKYVVAFSDPAFTDFSDSAVTLTQENERFFVTKNVAPAVVEGVEFDQWLDLGGIAKGFVIDEIKQIFEENGFERYYADAGTSSTVFGLNAHGDNFQLVLTDPLAPDSALYAQPLFGFEIGKSSASTSGQYVRKYVKDGVEYSHIIDGTTGAPAQTGVKMVSVVIPHDEGLWAGKSDCLTTALTVMGRDKIVDFVNGYLKQRHVSVVVVFETFDGKKEICSNVSADEILQKGQYFDTYAWALEQDEQGIFHYNANATFQKDQNEVYKTVAIVLASVCGAGIVALLVFHFAKGKKSALSKIQCARKDKPFKAADVGVYTVVALLIVVLFGVFFSGETQSVQVVQVVDAQTGEELFLYNALRDEYKFNQENSNGWTMEAKRDGNDLKVTFFKDIDGKTHFNTLRITRGRQTTVKMVDSLCGFHQDCVYNFGEITKGGGVIVCSPNRLKVTTE